MRQKECCIEYKTSTDFNFCPVCGIYIGENTYHVFEPSTINTSKYGSREETVETHPSYAQLQISRISSNKTGRATLFGSSIRHQNTIKLEIHSAEKIYDNYHERYFGAGLPYIEIEMSASQFAEAITSLNIGTGIPVTLRYLMGKVMPLCEELTMRQKVDNNIKKTFTDIVKEVTDAHKRIDEIQSIKGPLKAKEKAELIGLCKSLIQELNSNLPFFKQTVDEAIDKSVTQAKTEIDSMFQHTIVKLGMEKLSEITGGTGESISLLEE